MEFLAGTFFNALLKCYHIFFEEVDSLIQFFYLTWDSIFDAIFELPDIDLVNIISIMTTSKKSATITARPKIWRINEFHKLFEFGPTLKNIHFFFNSTF